ncbi:MAG TPA: hypothetical protein VGH27_15120 [Streptosporangiaceae bacterium]
MSEDPFRALGLPAAPDVSDDDVRAAWRRIAAATHPDREDGGDPARFALAAAAYTELRTRYGRGEAYADLVAGRPRPAAEPRSAAGPATERRSGAVVAQVRRGRPGVLALRVAIAAAISAIAFVVTGVQPAAIGLSVGAATWLLLTARHDLAR